MARTVIARGGDTLDGLLWRELGLTSAAHLLVLAKNPGIAAMPVLAAGTVVTVPETALSAPKKLSVINLWD